MANGGALRVFLGLQVDRRNFSEMRCKEKMRYRAFVRLFSQGSAIVADSQGVCLRMLT